MTTWRNNHRGLFVAIGIISALCFGSSSFAGNPESDESIKIAVNDWTSQLITSQTTGEVLKHMGYNVEYVQADYYAQFAGLESGDLTVNMEIWSTTAADAVAQSLATGNTANLGELGMYGEDFWWYPIYMKEHCPGLPDWKALLDEDCAAAFASDETAPKGRFLGQPVGWGEDDDGRVAAFGLPFEVIHAGSDTALFAEVEAAYARKDPVIAWLWSPHWAPAKYQGERVEFPAYEHECYTDPGWGMNPDMLYDCGKASGPIWKIAHAGGEAVWPKAYAAMRNVAFDNATMDMLVAKVELDGQSVEDVVAAWMSENESVWMAWAK